MNNCVNYALTILHILLDEEIAARWKRKERLADRALEIDAYPDSSLLETRFSSVDGVSNPAALLSPNTDMSLLKPFRLARDFHWYVKKNVTCGENPLQLITMSALDFNRDDRGLSPLNDGMHEEIQRIDSYEGSVGLHRYMGLEALLSNYARRENKGMLGVFDAGCGQAVAFGDILNIPVVSRELSMGIALELFLISEKIQDRVAKMNILFITPKSPDVRFYVYISVFGAVYYHPFRRTFALLQAMNFVKPRGLIILNYDSVDGIPLEDFIKMGLLKKHLFLPPDKKRSVSLPTIFQLQRHPTQEEVFELLRIKDSVMPYA